MWGIRSNNRKGINQERINNKRNYHTEVTENGAHKRNAVLTQRERQKPSQTG